MKGLDDVSDSTLTRGCNDCPENEEVNTQTQTLSQFSASPLCVEEGGWKGWEREWGSVFGGQPFILSWGKVSKSPPWHSSGLKEAPGQKWPKTGTDHLDVARDSHSAEALLGPSTVLSSVLTSLPGLEKEAGGSLTTRRTPYYTVCPHISRTQDRLTRFHQLAISVFTVSRRRKFSFFLSKSNIHPVLLSSSSGRFLNLRKDHSSLK